MTTGEIFNRVAAGVVAAGIVGLFLISFATLGDLHLIRGDITQIKNAALGVEMNTATRIIEVERHLKSLDDRILINDGRLKNLEDLYHRERLGEGVEPQSSAH